MKTLHITNAFHETSGGVRAVYTALMAQAEIEARRMVLVVPAERDSVESVGRFGKIYRVAAPRAPMFDRRYRVLLPHRFLTPRGRLREIIRQEDPEVVEIADKYALCYLAGLLRLERRRTGRGPTLVAASCERLDDNLRAWVSESPAAARAGRAFLGRVYMGMFDAHIANSSYTARELDAAMRLPHRRPVYVMPPGVHPVPPLSEAARHAVRIRLHARFGLPYGAPCLVYAGRLSPEKEVGTLIGVLARLRETVPSARLLIIGDGPSRGELESAAARATPWAVHFHPHVGDRAEYLELLGSADYFVHPNPREPFGIGPLEAMASGVPLIAPAAGGVLTYASSENAWLAAPDAGGLASAILAAMGDEDERRRRVVRARETAAAFAWPRAASRMLALYERLHRERLEPVSVAAAATAAAVTTGAAIRGRAVGPATVAEERG